jgi:glycosyltransferase involved in cell wall biosynthesis
MIRIDHVLVSAAPGDAVTDFARALRTVLSPYARSEIFALHYDPRLAGEVAPLQDYATRRKPRSSRDVIVFHLSIGEPEMAAFLSERPERIVVVYQNISPAEPFRAYDPTFSELLDQGRQLLASLAARATAALTPSEFNGGELRAAGYRSVELLPLVVDLSRLRSAEPAGAVIQRVRSTGPGPVILSVGQVLPHKRPDFVVEAFHILSTYLVPDAHLLLAGPTRLPAFGEAIQTQIDELHLERALVTGAVSTEELAACFGSADLFVTASEHEGFCVPLLEAMAFDLPFIARRFGAVPETAAGAGLLLDPADGPAVAAEAMAAVLGDARLRATLIEAGRRRLADFDIDRAKRAWRDALLALA